MIWFFIGIVVALAMVGVMMMSLFYNSNLNALSKDSIEFRESAADIFKKSALCAHYAAAAHKGDDMFKFMNIAVRSGTDGRLIEDDSPLMKMIIGDSDEEDFGITGNVTFSPEFMMGFLFSSYADEAAEKLFASGGYIFSVPDQKQITQLAIKFYPESGCEKLH
jgi:hypothetical protein